MKEQAGPASGPGVACIGAGRWGENLVRCFRELGALARVCEPDPERQRALAARFPGLSLTADLAAVLADPAVTAAAIATPAATHGSLVRQALLAGKDVFVEKPLCLSAAEGRELADLAAARGRVLMVGHILRYHPAFERLQELTAAGELGRLRYVYSHRLNLGQVRREENILWSFAPHDISAILALVGEQPEAVVARGGNYLDGGVADVTVSLLSFPGGVRAHVFVSWLHPFKEQRLVVVGDRQMAVFDDLAPADRLVLYPHALDLSGPVPAVSRAAAVPVPVPAAEPLLAECRHFLDCCRTRAVPRTDGAEALRVLAVLTACQDSLAGGAAVPADDAFIHPSSYVDAGAAIGPGTRIWHFCHILGGTRIGRNCRIGQNVVIGPNVQMGDGVKVQNNVSVYEGVTLEDGVFVGPAAVFTNVYNPRGEIPRMDQLRPTRVCRGATLGANCTLVCGITVGRYAFVGAGAVVLEDVPDHALVVGNPGRIAGWMCECGHRIDFAAADGPGACRCCRRPYHKSGRVVGSA